MYWTAVLLVVLCASAAHGHTHNSKIEDEEDLEAFIHVENDESTGDTDTQKSFCEGTKTGTYPTLAPDATCRGISLPHLQKVILFVSSHTTS